RFWSAAIAPRSSPNASSSRTSPAASACRRGSSPPRSRRSFEPFGMDLGIRGRRAIVCGGSKGLGRAAALALAREGGEVCLAARTQAALDAAAADIGRETGAKTIAVAGDVTTAAGRQAILAACPEPDILVTNPGVRQTPADFRTLSREDW